MSTWTAAEQARHDQHAEACEQAEAAEEVKAQEGRIECLEGDLDAALARVNDLETGIRAAIHQAVRISAATGRDYAEKFCRAHLENVLTIGKKQEVE